MISKMKLNEKGFTLIELMVVVAIIGIIAAVALVPAIQAKKNAVDSAVSVDIAKTSGVYNTCREGNVPMIITTQPDGDVLVHCQDDSASYFMSAELIHIEFSPEIGGVFSQFQETDDSFVGKAFSEKGSKTFCLYHNGDLDSYKGLSFDLCPDTNM